MADLIVGAVVIVILGGAIWYIIKAKKNGAKCIGCPSGENCCSKKSCNYGCDENE